MFQTELHRWLQSFDSPVIRLAMQAISLLGTEEFYTLLIVVLMFGMDRHRGFIIMQVILWTAIITAMMKDFFALPRPVDVDSLVQDLDTNGSQTSVFTGRGASEFLAPLPDDVVAYYRHTPNVAYGFPSGHCSSSVATWGSLALLFRRTWLVWFTVAIFVLMPISRMYLGRHFLADVLGGLVLGLLVVTAVATLQRSWVFGIEGGREFGEEQETASMPGQEHDAVNHGEHDREHLSVGSGGGMTFAAIRDGAFMFVLPLVLMLLSPSAGQKAALLLGLNMGYLATRRLVALDGPRTVPRRILTVLLAAAVTVSLILLLNAVNSRLQVQLSQAVTLTEQTVLAALIVILTHALAKVFLVRTISSKPA